MKYFQGKHFFSSITIVVVQAFVLLVSNKTHTDRIIVMIISKLGLTCVSCDSETCRVRKFVYRV